MEEQTMLPLFTNDQPDQPPVLLQELTTTVEGYDELLKKGYYRDVFTQKIEKRKFPYMQCDIIEGNFLI